MNIRHERPMPDMAFRMRAPLGLTLRDGTRARIEDWSMRGLSAPGLMDKDVSDAILAIPFQGVVLSFPIKLHPSDEPDFYEFREMNSRQRETLALFYRNLLSGKMAATTDMITALDTPVDLVPMDETEAERARSSGGRVRRIIRSAISLTVYLALSVLVFGYLGNLAWQRLSSIHLSQPRFVAPLETLTTQMSGFVDDIRAPVERATKAGAVVVVLTDPELQTAMDQIQFEIRAMQAEHAQITRRIETHMQNREAVRARLVAQRKADLAMFDHRDFVEGRHQTLRSVQALHSFDLGISLAPRDFNDVLGQLQGLENKHLQQLRLLHRERANIQAQMQGLQVRAPFDGAITELLIQPEQYLRAGADVALFEADQSRHVLGWLDARLAADAYIGMPAKIIFNIDGTKRELPGTVTDLQAGMNPNEPDRFGSTVTVEAVGLTRQKTREIFANNAPAVVKLDRQLIQRLFGDGA